MSTFVTVNVLSFFETSPLSVPFYFLLVNKISTNKTLLPCFLQSWPSLSQTLSEDALETAKCFGISTYGPCALFSQNFKIQKRETRAFSPEVILETDLDSA